MLRINKIDHTLATLRSRIFTPLDTPVALKFLAGTADDRPRALSGDTEDWRQVTGDLAWGEPDAYFWFAGSVTIPEEAQGRRVFLHVDAQFGSMMGRSDPQCLVRVDGKLAQGVDGNHRELLLTEHATTGTRYEIMIEAGTIEDRRQVGFGCRLMVHDALSEQVYYDLRAPMDVARLLADDDPRKPFLINTIDAALAVIDFRPGPERFARSLEAARDMARTIYEAADFEDKPVITVTGHTHIDVAWLWRMRETRQKMARSMSTALALMEQYPDYRFMYNQGVLLDHLKADYPELFERLSGAVARGQFEIEGALWLEPDANITSGESFVRHIMHGVNYHEQTFGVRPRIMWLPDTFGYSAALPQIMRLSGLDVFVTHKMSWNDTNKMPSDTFFWQGIDGSSVAAYFLTAQPYDAKSINTTYGPDLKPSHVMGTWRRYGQKDAISELFLVYGHGDGGGGPTREMLENIRRMERGIPGLPTVRHGHMRPFFERLLARMEKEPERFPHWVGELYLEFHRGTLTSIAKNKRSNRLAETAMREIEALATLATVAKGNPYPQQRLHALWRVVLLNQFHDILPGSSIGPVYDDSDVDYAWFFDEIESLRTELAAQLSGEGAMVFNVLPRPRSGLLTWSGDRSATATIGEYSAASQTLVRADGSYEQAVPVRDLPPTGVVPVSLNPGEAGQVSDELSVSTGHLENAFLKVLFDTRGRITSILDKRSGREVVKPGQLANRLQAFRDMPPQYDAWDIDPGFEDQSWDIDELVSAEVVETGPYRAAVRFEWAYEASRIVQVVALEAGADQIDIDGFIDWREHHTLVKAAFPLDVVADATTAEIQFGHVRRPTHRNTSWDQARFETLMHRWVDIAEPGFGVALLNDCKYGYDAKGTTLRLTLLRSPTFPWAEADQGEHRFRYAILVHRGTLAGEGVPAKAEEFNLPLRLIGTPGEIAVSGESLLALEGTGCTVESIKIAETGTDVIARVWETHGAYTHARLTLPRGFMAAVETDLLERNPVPLPMTNGILELDLSPFQIRTIRLSRI
ncbi:glycosyl hydrolase-related protein [Pelagibacterium sp. 26DY04]|uniref:alpha-mannosidase n=1 Tax=Pelagibacterium sp. 26DY04 TaxID=2967130 RepID=UPI002816489A|nr:glycoside hydrolase family 38 C-terminal domain-containing protein [Pelagibacterium sp. 26DY04]WMT88435.1 glycosyl hydrolase-related protein [Pelagibacterium sp. 26DY04]